MPDKTLDTLLSLIKLIGYCFSPVILLLYRLVSRTPQPKPDFKDDIVLVTGGASGLGRALAEQYCTHGAVAVIWDVSGEALEQTREAMAAKGYEVHTYVVDCSDKEQVYNAAARVREEVGDVSVLVNNAGIVRDGYIMDLKDSDIERVYQLNTLAHYWLIRAFLPWMIDNNYGYIVNIVSSAAFTGFPSLSTYTSSKAAALSLCESLKLELRQLNKHGVSVTAVCPWHIGGTGMFQDFQVPAHYLIPPLKTSDVAKRVVRATYDRQFCLLLPAMLWIAVILKQLLPSKAAFELADITGAKGYSLPTTVAREQHQASSSH